MQAHERLAHQLTGIKPSRPYITNKMINVGEEAPDFALVD